MVNMLFPTYPELTTERLILRKLAIEDENEILLLRSDGQVNRFIDRPKMQTVEESRAFIEKILKNVAVHEVFYWAIEWKNSDKLIWTVCLWNISVEDSSAEIGFELFPDYQGKGIMGEAVARVLEFGFTDMQLMLITGWIHKENVASIKLVEKFHFNRDAELESKYADLPELKTMVIYSLVRPVL